jgi:hypothetical protein
MMYRIGLLGVLLMLLGAPRALGQYELIELGGRAGVGTNVPFGFMGLDAGNVSPSWGYNIDGFYSHYFCGKQYGIHGELGLRGYGLAETAPDLGPSMVADTTGGDLNYNLHYGSAGFYFKIRKNNFHLRREFCLMFGPKVNLRLFSSFTNDAGESDPFDADKRGYRDVRTIIPGLHLSGWWRFPAQDRRSWFVAVGIEAFSTNVSTEADLGYASLYPFVNVGYSFWNNL